MRVEFPCQQCGKPVELEFPDVAIAEGGMLASVACTGCGAQHAAEVEMADGKPRVQAELGLMGGAIPIPLARLGAMLGRQSEQEREDHKPLRNVHEIKLAEELYLAIAISRRGFLVRVSDGRKVGEWREACGGCMQKVGSEILRLHGRAVKRGELLGKLNSIPLMAAHEVAPGQTLETIAEIHYGDRALQAELYTANRDLLEVGEQPQPGDVLRIPKRDDGAAAVAIDPGDGT